MKPKVEIPKVEMPTQGDDTIFYIIAVLFIILFSLFFLYLFIIGLKRFFKIKRPINIDDKHLIKKPFLPAALSILFPGFGQIYNKDIDRGAIYIILTVSTCLVLFITLALTADLALTDDLDLTAVNWQIVSFVINILSISFLIFVYINSIIDAYSTAMAINSKILRIMRQNENHLMDLMKLGRALYNQQNYQDALELYTAIISLYPTHALAHYNRAVVYYKFHNYSKAGIDFISAAKLGHEKAERILNSEGIENL
jgi:tetratricopeptide (TPR) repeat protein